MPIINTVGTWLSNFQRVNIIGIDGCVYPSVEHAYQASKTSDRSIRATLQSDMSPNDLRCGLYAKQLAKRLRLAPLSETRRIEVMRQLIGEKFSQEPFMSRLLETGDSQISEIAPWDRFWGTGPDGRGHDWLGKLIMERRSLILGAIEEIEDGGIRGI